MRTRPSDGEWPTAASTVWLALDRYEIRPFSRVVAILLSGRLARLGRAWKGGPVSEGLRTTTWRRARKWADVNTSRGLDWLVLHQKARRVGGGYLRARPESTGALDRLLDAMVEAEQRLRGIRTILASNPEFPGTDPVGAAQRQWAGDLEYLLGRLDFVTCEVEKRELRRGRPLRHRAKRPGGAGMAIARRGEPSTDRMQPEHGTSRRPQAKRRYVK